MNKYEKLFEDIIDKTYSDDIEWKQVSKSAHSDLIFNSEMSFRQYSGEYKKGGKTYEVVFVEKKADDPEYDFTRQRYSGEVLVIDEKNELLVTLTDSVIDKDKMDNLVNSIEGKNDRSKKLFE